MRASLSRWARFRKSLSSRNSDDNLICSLGSCELSTEEVTRESERSFAASPANTDPVTIRENRRKRFSIVSSLPFTGVIASVDKWIGNDSPQQSNPIGFPRLGRLSRGEKVKEPLSGGGSASIIRSAASTCAAYPQHTGIFTSLSRRMRRSPRTLHG